MSVAPAAAVRQALNLMSTWGVSQIPVLENGQSVGGLIEGTLMTRALAQPALLDRPVREVMDPPFPEVEAGTADRSGGRDAHPGEPGGAGAEGREADRHREPVRRAAAADRDAVEVPTSQFTHAKGFMRVTVLTGGTSSERDVAIASAVQVIGALRSPGPRGGGRGHRPGLHPRGRRARPAARARWAWRRRRSTQLQALEQGLLLSGLGNMPVVRDADVLFLALHGGRGEDGTMQTLLEMVGVPYTGSGRLGSAMAMDKDVSKRLFRVAGVPTADWVMAPADRARVGRELGWPVVVKPSKQGSTVGLTVVKAAPRTTRRRWPWPAGTTTRS